MFLFCRSLHPGLIGISARGQVSAVYKSGPGAPLSGSARAARACCTELCCCPPKTGTVEGSSAASRTSDEGPGELFLCTGIFLGKQILPCPASSRWSNFLLLPRPRLLSSTERSCLLSFLTLLGGSSAAQSSCAWVSPRGGNPGPKIRALSSSASCRPRLAAALSLMFFLILQEGGLLM